MLLPASMAAMGIAGSRRCWSEPAGRWARTESSTRIWRREGLKVPKKQKPRGRLWLNDGSCVRLQADARQPCVELRLRECANARRPQRAHPEPDRRIHAGVPADPCGATLEFGQRSSKHWPMSWCLKGVPEHLRSDNGPEFVAKDLRKWLADYRRKDAVHRTRLSMGERLLRIVQLQTQRRVPQRRDLLLASKNCVCWPSAGASTTTPSDHTPRWDIDLRSEAG